MTILAAIIVAIQGAILARGAMLHSPCWDEVGHLVAGLSHWELGRFDLYRVNPPLVRYVATLPVYLAGASLGPDTYDPAPWRRPEFELGARFIRRYGIDSLWYFRLGRWTCLPFAALGGWICFQWARELHGNLAGLAALSLWCFSPTILANAQMMTPDTGAAALGVAASYQFRRWLSVPDWPRAALAGLMLGVALLSKFTMLVLVFAWPMCWIVRIQRRRGLQASPASRASRSQVLQLGLMAVLSLYTINLGYGLERSFERLGDLKLTSMRLGRFGQDRYDATYYRSPFEHTLLAGFPVPVPGNYIQGIDVQLRDYEGVYDSYLRGKWSKKGWWYYYLYAFLVKETLGTIALVVLATAGLRSGGRGSEPAEGACVAIPAILVYIAVSSQTGFSHHYRYVLPAWPFICIFTSRIFADTPAPPRRLRCLAAVLLTWSVVAALRQGPHFLSYFNEFAGGPMNGSKHLDNSNIDWGQDLLFLKAWCDEHRDARPLEVVYSGSFSPADLRIWGEGILFLSSPSSSLRLEKGSPPRPRWYAIFLGRLNDPVEAPGLDPFAEFRGRKPDHIVGNTVFIFRDSP